ncbi:MAG: hypothetical protein FJ104_09935 [Deltaproteobacteria bacterium]|nr:hypothetical protein [Deltaproteobacteria bacterium]
MRRLSALLLVLAPLAAATGCFAPPPPSQRVADIAREVNLATRFGRMDFAMGHLADGTRAHFTRRRAEWGQAVRILDLELTGLNMKDSEHATVLVDVQWTRLDESTLNVTRIEQEWRGTTEDDGWVLARERRVGGDVGLFGEKRPAPAEPEAHGDVHFASRTIR